MSKEAKKVINEEISKNEACCDLSSVEVSPNNLSYILDQLNNNRNIGYIKLIESNNSGNEEIKDLKE